MANSTRPGKQAKSAQRNLANQGNHRGKQQSQSGEQQGPRGEQHGQSGEKWAGRGVRSEQSPQERQRIQRDPKGGQDE